MQSWRLVALNRGGSFEADRHYAILFTFAEYQWSWYAVTALAVAAIGDNMFHQTIRASRRPRDIDMCSNRGD